MNKRIPDNFCGVLRYNCDADEWDTFFSVSDDLVTLLPADEKCKKSINESLSLRDLNNKNVDGWLFGYSENGCSVAFYKPGILNIGLSFPINLQPAKFRAPIILQSTTPSGMDLHTFNEIEFREGIVDLLHIPSKAFEGSANDYYLKFRSPDQYTHTFPVTINGTNFDVSYTVSFSDLVREMGKVPDLRKLVHSSLKFKFYKPQSLETFEIYYKYALRLFQFCARRSNISFSVRLNQLSDKSKYTVLSRFIDGFDDYANEKLNVTQVIQLEQLNKKFSNLFKIINEDGFKPNLTFLPKRNKDINYVYHTNITDLCVALEQEYYFMKSDVVENDRIQAKKLAKELNKFIDKSEFPECVKEKSKALNNGILANMQPSLKDKIIALYNDFSAQISEISKNKYYTNDGIKQDYSDAEFIELIGKFVQIRHHVAHAGIIWNEGVAIYQHLQMLVYFCILKRAGYTQEESKELLINLFRWYF